VHHHCLAPLVKAIDDRIGVVSGLMNTIHSFTNDQVLTDVYQQGSAARALCRAQHDPDEDRRRRGGGTRTAAPHGKLDGFSIRVPTINVSIVDLTFRRQEGDYG